MKIFYRLLCALLLCINFTALPLFADAADKNIIILHTNDIHCGIEDNLGLPKLVQYKKELQKNNHVILVDSGDAIQGAPIGRLSEGAAMIRLMNLAGYDLAVPGNHEFDYGMEAFLKLSQQLSCGYYSANFNDLRRNRPVLPAYKIITAEDKKIAFIGVTTPETLTSSTPRYFQDDKSSFIYGFYESNDGQMLYDTIQKNIDTVKQLGADYVFLVSHLGLHGTAPQYSAAAVIANTHGLTGVLDGHSHEKITGTALYDKNRQPVILGQTGTKLQSIGMLTITPSGSISYQLTEKLTAADSGMQTTIAAEKSIYGPLLNEPVGHTSVPLYTTDPADKGRMVRSRECNLGDFIADAYRAVLGTDIALVNGGGIRADIPQGTISYRDIMNVVPFDNMCSVIEITGQQLADALEYSVSRYPQEYGGFLQVSGLKFTVDSSIPSSVIRDDKGRFIKTDGPRRVSGITVNGRPVDLNKKYTVGGTAYLLLYGGNGMSMFKDAAVLKPALMNETDAVIEYLQNHLNAEIGPSYLDPYGTGRIDII